jgi:hypothetical protein
LLALPIDGDAFAGEAGLFACLPVQIRFGRTDQFHLEVATAGDQQIGVVGTRTQLQKEVGVTAIGFVRQYAGDRQAFVVEPMPQRWRLAAATRRTRPQTGSVRAGALLFFQDAASAW